MNTEQLESTAEALVVHGKGILAADESFGTIQKRFNAVGIESTEDTRRAYREMLFTTQGIGDFLGGVILFEETLRTSTADGRPFPEVLTSLGVLPGIKLDKGAKDMALFPGEQITEGLDGLRERVAEAAQLGARFAKWRAVINIEGDDIPTTQAIDSNSEVLARYAALCQEGGLVPIVEPEVLMDGSHTLERCDEVTHETLHSLFDALHRHRVHLRGVLLKPNMVVPGKQSPVQASVEQVARTTVECLLRSVPASVPGVVFLSGGQSGAQATAHLNAMNRLYKGQLPWVLSFSYARALQDAAMKTWGGKPENIEAAQKAFYDRLRLAALAATGEYDESMEEQLTAA
ncbi:MAG: fructose-bisphosphate aldolase class I [Chloroflexota bacterium]|nr:fructose-bisphosphate aldolase class I [Chloroflexota bacterium]